MKKICLLVLLASGLFLGAEQVSETQTKSDNSPAKQDKDGPKIIALKSGEPDELTYDAGTVRFLASSKDTNGAWSLVELTEKPGYKTRLHRHIYTDEAYYVLEGVLTAKIADKTYELPAGSYILIPHGTPHAQGNIGKVPVKVLLTMTPGGFEGSFKDRAELIKTVKSDDPNFVKMREQMMIKGKYDREYLGDWNPQE
ncbi:MAG TPA: cupin domain-containing protein [Pyrinomonadaceae bacterium]